MTLVQRSNEGRPILMPQGDGWESGAVWQASATYLPPWPEYQPVLQGFAAGGTRPDPRLRRGAVAVHYCARPSGAVAEPHTRLRASAIGLAVFTPELDQLIYRRSEPALRVDPDPSSEAHQGVADPRITRINGAFWMSYLAMEAAPAAQTSSASQLCMARSSDLQHWEKLGPILGAATGNSGGVLLPEPVNGEYVLLHAPLLSFSSGEAAAIHVATTSNLDLPDWRDRGLIMRASESEAGAWITPASSPIALGDRRFLILYNTSRWIAPGVLRRSEVGAAILNLQHPRLDTPASVLESRLEPLLTAETDLEIRGALPASAANVLSSSGCYEHQGHLHIVYSAGDNVVLAAKVSKDELMRRLNGVAL